jgi:hypothetical protein
MATINAVGGSRGRPRFWSRTAVTRGVDAGAGGWFAVWLILLAGGVPEVLVNYPRDRQRHQRIGFAIVASALLATLSATGGLIVGFHIHEPVVILVVAALYGVLMGNLEALFTISLRRLPKPGLTAALALVRLSLATVVGLVVSVPLTLVLFMSGIHSTIPLVKAGQRTTLVERVDHEAQYQQIPSLTSQVAAMRNTADTTGAIDPDSDPLVAQLQTQVLTDRATLERDQRESVCEVGGTCGSGKAGVGPVADRLQRLIHSDKNTLDEDENALSKATAAADHRLSRNAHTTAVTAQHQLPALSHELQTLKNERETEIRLGLAAINNSNGLVSELEALSLLGHQHPVVRTAHYLLIALLTIIDTAAVSLKMIMLFGPATPYEKDMDDRERRETEQTRITSDTAISMATAEATAQTQAANEKAGEIIDEAQANRQLAIDIKAVHDRRRLDAEDYLAQTITNIYRDTVAQRMKDHPEDFIT